MASIIDQEIDEDLQRARLLRLWRRYGPYAIGGLALLVFVIAAVVLWRESLARERARAASAYIEASEALERGAYEEAARLFAALKATAPGGYRMLAALREAEARRADGKGEAALAALAEAAAGGDALLADLAALGIALASADFATVAELQARLGPMLAPAHPFRAFARELLAFALYRESNFTEALVHLEAILAEPGLPPRLRERSLALKALIDAKMPPATAPAVPAPAQP